MIISILECSLTDLTPDNAVRHCVDRGFVNTLPTPSGVVCYNRTTTGSEAVYICEDGFHQDGAEMRVCQSGGVWNGSIATSVLLIKEIMVVNIFCIFQTTALNRHVGLHQRRIDSGRFTNLCLFYKLLTE